MEPVKLAAFATSILQLKVRLLDISPMIWRRVLVRESVSLRELHGVIQLAMGWEGVHLFEFTIRGSRYAGPFLGGPSPDVPLSNLRFRRNSRVRYVYDMYCGWAHEIRLEKRVPVEPAKYYPRCVGGAGACPPEDCGGPDAYHAGREEAMGPQSMDDLAEATDIFEQILIDKGRSGLDDDTWLRLEEMMDRFNSRARFLATTFSRGAVNRGFRAGDHRRLMHQQM